MNLHAFVYIRHGKTRDQGFLKVNREFAELQFFNTKEKKKKKSGAPCIDVCRIEFKE